MRRHSVTSAVGHQGVRSGAEYSVSTLVLKSQLMYWVLVLEVCGGIADVCARILPQ